MSWFYAHLSELSYNYSDEWIAVSKKGKIVAHAKELTDILTKVEKLKADVVYAYVNKGTHNENE